MYEKSRGWVEILASNDADGLWAKLFKLVSKHSAIRNLLGSRTISRDSLKDFYTDITQDLYLRLYEKGRWHYYLDARYVDADIEHELYHIEIPNFVSLLLRERHPEAYRMARRVSNLIQTSHEFQRYTRSADSERKGKLILKVYGLKGWPEDKQMKSYQNMRELIKDVPCRRRDRRRAGRGSSPHIIISNNDLTELIIEIFKAIDSPADVRIIRSLVLSKLPVEDSRFISIDAALTPETVSDPTPMKVDFADHRPTPEEILLEHEITHQADFMAVEMLEKMREVVRNKPNRYNRLARVAWHCYFDMSSPSQTSIARMIGISNSLVSHYRKLFDTILQNVELQTNECLPFLNAFGAKLETSITETASACNRLKSKPDAFSASASAEMAVAAKPMAAAAGRFR
jgi:hypothetical protein